jgi:hypothetical protein
MSKKIVLTLPDDIFKDVIISSKKLGVTHLEYIRYLILKDKETRSNTPKVT